MHGKIHSTDSHSEMAKILELSDKDQNINYKDIPTSKCKHSWNEWKYRKFQQINRIYKENPNVNIRIKERITKIKISLDILNRIEMTEEKVSELNDRWEESI